MTSFAYAVTESKYRRRSAGFSQRTAVASTPIAMLAQSATYHSPFVSPGLRP